MESFLPKHLGRTASAASATPCGRTRLQSLGALKNVYVAQVRFIRSILKYVEELYRSMSMPA